VDILGKYKTINRTYLLKGKKVIKLLGWVIFCGFVMMSGWFGQFIFRLGNSYAEPSGWEAVTVFGFIGMLVTAIVLSSTSTKE